MPKEIERKFLVRGEAWRGLGEGKPYCQGYIPTEGCRVRVRRAGDQGFLTIKGPRSGISRDEYEYEIPASEADELLRLCGKLIEKTRYRVRFAGMTWEVDEFHGANQGLVIAEVELESENQQVEVPEWVGEEVSEDDRYSNYALSLSPWRG